MKAGFTNGYIGEMEHDKVGDVIAHKSYSGFCGDGVASIKERPGDLVVFLAVGEGEEGGVAALDLAGAAGEGVVEDGGGGDGTGGELAGFLELAEFFPTLDLCPLPFASKSNFLSVVQGAVARFRASVPDILSDSRSN